jgi:hypothetical protein
MKVYYEGVEVGDYYADFLVAGCVIVELKSVERLADEHHAQLLNNLRATDIEVGLLLNFGPNQKSNARCVKRYGIVSCLYPLHLRRSPRHLRAILEDLLNVRHRGDD